MKNPEIAKRITYILNLRGMKAQELADKTGINKASISQYVNGNHCPSNDTAKSMADVLRVNPLWLMGFDVPMEIEVIPTEHEMPEHLKRYYEYFKRYASLQDSDKTLVDNLIESLSQKK